MTQEDKELLLKDICARLPYNVIIHLDYGDGTIETREMGLGSLHDFIVDNAEVKPYLRPMSSMTDVEEFAYHNVYVCPINNAMNVVDWLLENHFDFRGLIEKGLALEAPEGMYSINN